MKRLLCVAATIVMAVTFSATSFAYEVWNDTFTATPGDYTQLNNDITNPSRVTGSAVGQATAIYDPWKLAATLDGTTLSTTSTAGWGSSYMVANLMYDTYMDIPWATSMTYSVKMKPGANPNVTTNGGQDLTGFGIGLPSSPWQKNQISMYVRGQNADQTVTKVGFYNYAANTLNGDLNVSTDGWYTGTIALVKLDASTWSCVSSVANTQGDSISTSFNVADYFLTWSGGDNYFNGPYSGTRVELSGTAGVAGITHQFDDLKIDVVPEPGTIAAIVSGLAGLALIRRKK